VTAAHHVRLLAKAYGVYVLGYFLKGKYI